MKKGASENINIDCTLKRIMAGALLTGGVAVAGLGIGAVTAHAKPTGPHHWCPGDPMQYQTQPWLADHTGPGPAYSWDMNICHTWFWLANGNQGNVPYKGKLPSDVWDGENPPGPVAQLPDYGGL
jgi:hypothetical protein